MQPWKKMNNIISLYGELYFLDNQRTVGTNATWIVRDFVVKYQSGGRDQYRIVQAVKDAVNKLDDIRLGDKIKITVMLKGKESQKPGMGKRYFNLDECDKIELI